jgi:hypothetical protein
VLTFLLARVQLHVYASTVHFGVKRSALVYFRMASFRRVVSDAKEAVRMNSTESLLLLLLLLS